MDRAGQVTDATASPEWVGAFRGALLDWYDEQGRVLPWRVRPEDRARGVEPDPYAVWLSEVMLQQTTVAHGTRYWHAFLERFPTVCDLAKAPTETVMGMWAGLGYYARARNLHACAKRVCGEMGGVFPTDEKTLLTLPGIGPYTAAAIAAICAGEATNVVDGNVERVVSRLFAVQVPLPKGRRELKRLAGQLVRAERAGDYPQAMMDLGATVCRPRNPRCEACPVSAWCAAREEGGPERYPLKVRRAKTPTRRGYAYVLRRDGQIWLQRRPDAGLLGGMLGFPTSEWSEDPSPAPPCEADWKDIGTARHTFSHFHLELTVMVGEGAPTGKGEWVSEARTVELPSVMTKVLAKVRERATAGPPED